MKNKKGFTLVEVLIVVGIIGLLASIVLSGLGSVRSRGRDARRVADLRQVQQGLELYYTRCQKYPGGQDCSAQTINGGPTSWKSLSEALTLSAGLGISRISNDPQCDDVICDRNYRYSGNNDEYVLEAVLEDDKSPLLKDSFTGSFSNTSCSTARHYCVKF